MEVAKTENSGILLPISNIYKPGPYLNDERRNSFGEKKENEPWYFEKDGGMEPPIPVGDKMVVEVYFPGRSEGGLMLAEGYQEKLKFSSVVGRVIKLGS